MLLYLCPMVLGMESVATYSRIEGGDTDEADLWKLDMRVLNEIAIFTSHFTISLADARTEVCTVALYDRGCDSSAEPVYHLQVNERQVSGGDFKANFFEKHLELFYGIALGVVRPKIFSSGASTAEEYKEAFKNHLGYANINSPFLTCMGLNIDNTDDRNAPFEGYHLQVERQTVQDKKGNCWDNAVVESFFNSL